MSIKKKAIILRLVMIIMSNTASIYAEKEEYNRDKPKYNANYEKNKASVVLNKKIAEQFDKNGVLKEGKLKNYQDKYRGHLDELKKH